MRKKIQKNQFKKNEKSLKLGKFKFVLEAGGFSRRLTKPS